MIERQVLVHFKPVKGRTTACGEQLESLGSNYSTCWCWVNCKRCISKRRKHTVKDCPECMVKAEIR